ncbi:MAG: ABC transporter ATP-binding protein [Candidatus Nanopelagicales bacterium]|nr:ABC transporter ATP-binding protein [Candidatus Nanopelagicales bacterium]MDZ4249338.1 ABC transporter ATP-binding protein [Candidatus Nanopelagicales bacterium]
MVDPAIVVDQLRVDRGGQAVLHEVSCQIAAGQITGLLGPSGGGKTTMMRAIVGVQYTHGGTVTVLGRPAGDPDLRHRIGYVTQDPSVYADLSVRENIRYFGKILGTPVSDVDRVLTEVGLTDMADRRVSRLSGGQRGRASLAVALLGSPEVLILDEPTVGLDPVLRRDLWNIFRSLADNGVTLVVSSHVMDEASRCDRMLLLRQGRILADDTLDSVLAETGTGNVESAFLALVEREGASGGERGGA